MYELKTFQETAVNSLLDHTYQALQEPHHQIPILLEAPTGSGKTVIMASYIERLVDELHLRPGLNDNVAFIWFAPNTLHIQSYNSLKELYEDTRKLNCVSLDDLGTNPQLEPKDLLFVNWSSVDSLKNLWRKDNETNTNLEALIENTKAHGTQIILVIDEAHLSAFNGKQAIKVRKLIEAKVEVSVTATPKARSQRSVYISRQQVVAEEMIKKGVRLNIGLDPSQQNGENVHIHLLRTAWKKKEELKKLYAQELGEGVINPLLLIQLPSDKATLSEDDKNIRDILVGLLNTEYDVSTQNGKLAIWLSGERDTDGLEEPNGVQDVLIFKQAIAQGWNCPRASVLVSYRTTQSPDFGVQTVGRILRMPHRRHYQLDDLNHGYVYTNIESTRINLVPSDADYIHLQLATRQEDRGWVFDKLQSSIVVNDRPAKGILTSVFETHFFNVMEARYGIKQLPDIDLFTSQEEEELVEQKKANVECMEQNGWTFDIDDNQIVIPADIEIDPYSVDTYLVDHDHLQRFDITTAEFQAYFDQFCYESITRLNRSKSWKKLRDTLIFFAEYYLGLFEQEAKRLFLHPQNRALLIQHINQALERFDQWQQAKGNERRRVEPLEWEVPEYRYYTEHYSPQDDIDSHALLPFYEYNDARNPEKAFKSFLVANQDEIEWWYKNGDSGKEHFAVPYIKDEHQESQRPSLFFVDFVVKFKSGKIGLFDTKTPRSDSDAPAKHNGLIDFVESENVNKPERQLFGGVLIEEEQASTSNFRYCPNRIADTKDLMGWEYLNPANINKD